MRFDITEKRESGSETMRHQGWIRQLFLREDAIYDHYAAIGQAKSPRAKAFYLLMHLLPGITGWVFINVNSIYQAELRFTGLPGRTLQYLWVLVVAFGLHIVVPILFLRFNDKLTWKQSLEFLGLNRVDLRGLFMVLPVYCVLFAFFALPYMQWIWNPLERWLQSVPAFQMPAYTIFKGGPDGLYSFPPIALLLSASIMVQKYLRPAAVKAGVIKEDQRVRFGFHNFRHSLASSLVKLKCDPKTVQGILRHEDVRTTMQLYAQSDKESRLEAQGKFLALLLGDKAHLLTETIQ